MLVYFAAGADTPRTVRIQGNYSGARKRPVSVAAWWQPAVSAAQFKCLVSPALVDNCSAPLPWCPAHTCKRCLTVFRMENVNIVNINTIIDI